jgi:hypothetical protein
MTAERASDVFEIVMVDREDGALKRVARWGGTLVAGLLDGSSMSPALSELAIRRDGVDLRRVTASDVGDLQNLHTRLLHELETSTPEEFAASWELDPA